MALYGAIPCNQPPQAAQLRSSPMPTPKSRTFSQAAIQLIHETHLLLPPIPTLQQRLAALSPQELQTLAKQSGIHPYTLSRLKNNRFQHPGKQVLSALASALSMPLREVAHSFPFHLNRANVEILYKQSYTIKEISQILSVSDKFAQSTVYVLGIADRGSGTFQRKNATAAGGTLPTKSSRAI